jgi:hypothetical protein
MGFGFAVVAAVGVDDDSFDHTRTLAKLAGAAVEGPSRTGHSPLEPEQESISDEATL